MTGGIVNYQQYQQKYQQFARNRGKLMRLVPDKVRGVDLGSK